MSVAAIGWWVGNIVSGQLSPFLLSSPLGTAGTLLLHVAICAIVFVFVLLLLPETKVVYFTECFVVCMTSLLVRMS